MEGSSMHTADDVDVDFALEKRQAVTHSASLSGSMAIGDDDERPCDRELGPSRG